MNNNNITKDELIEIIKNWVSIDKDIKDLQKQIKEKKNKQKNITTNLIEIMKNNDIDCFDINNGKLLYKENKIKSSLSKTFILNSLNSFFKDDTNINTLDITNHILNNRNIKIKEEIKCKFYKK